jgi:hypothetical protein
MANGAPQMTDTVQFRSRFGPLGTMADRLVLNHYLPRLLRRRNTSLKSTLEARG